MIYLTFNDAPSGIYFSQVTDVCRFLNSELNAKTRLVAFISFRNFFTNKKSIKAQMPGSIVIPMFPKLRNWKLNVVTLLVVFLFVNSKKVIARGPFAASMALMLRNTG